MGGIGVFKIGGGGRLEKGYSKLGGGGMVGGVKFPMPPSVLTPLLSMEQPLLVLSNCPENFRLQYIPYHQLSVPLTPYLPQTHMLTR